ncbi:YL1-domain-containing protein [Dothidotthia symphoricarpi CBS 119687]|uniref:YL1-domain-containing protein n=1 Tax=Dothidotthia symphoricarpi CBS 119687 TaxID=1392245 RepID=A0A6A6A4L0_9PLEO|nr:YL1-domain-containing protein [Dothidotthia symphoricarpi CBS 119687]KAF2126105.1 YL1-domain-containing protein [Dothidotthia symphoricarpi CBS 119687]
MDVDVDGDDPPPFDHHEEDGTSEDESEPEAPVDLMVTSRARRSNAGNRMSILLAKSAEEEEDWGEEWEDAPNEEDFKGEDANEQEDYNLDSSSSEEEDGGGDDDETGEKELRKVERQEQTKKRKAVTNPFAAARMAAASRKRVKLDGVHAQSPSMAPPPRPKKKSERASWIPTEEDGPVRASSRKQTIANKESTLTKLKEKDKRRDDTLAMMKAAEARKAKDEPKPLTQAERLAEAARNERVNKKTLHRWEEAEEARAADRQAKIDALKNRQIDGPFIRYYSGPAIYVDDKLKYTGKDAPSLEHLEDKLNRNLTATDSETVTAESAEQPVDEAVPNGPMNQYQTSTNPPSIPSIPTSLPPQQSSSQQPWTPASQAIGGDVFMGGDIFMGSHSMPYPSSIMFTPPQNQDSFLYGIDQYAQAQQPQSTPSDLPPNPFSAASSYNPYNAPQLPFTHPHPHPSLSDPLLTQDPTATHSSVLSSFQKPLLPAPPPRKKQIRRALRNLLILSSFPDLDAPPSSSRYKSTASLTKDKDRTALIHLCTTLFHWSPADASTFVNVMLVKPVSKKAAAERDAALRPKVVHCEITNKVARYRDPETGIAYRDARAFGVLRGVVGGGFVWSGDLGCYVGGRAKPLESMGGKGFLGMPPAAGVPRRFLEMRRMGPPPMPALAPTPTPAPASAPSQMPVVDAASESARRGPAVVKVEDVAGT